MIRNLLKKRQGKVNTETKELNRLTWEYATLYQELVQYAAKHLENKVMVLFIEDSLTECEITLKEESKGKDTKEKIHNTEKAIKKLNGTKQFVDVYGNINK